MDQENRSGDRLGGVPPRPHTIRSSTQAPPRPALPAPPARPRPMHLILEMMCESVRLNAHSSPHVCANTRRPWSSLACSSAAEAAATASASAAALAPGMMLERERCATGVSVLATTCGTSGKRKTKCQCPVIIYSPPATGEGGGEAPIYPGRFGSQYGRWAAAKCYNGEKDGLETTDCTHIPCLGSSFAGPYGARGCPLR